MSSCKLCDERKEEIIRILSSYKRDKKIALITIGILILELIFTLAYGAEGITLGINIIKGMIK